MFVGGCGGVGYVFVWFECYVIMDVCFVENEFVFDLVVVFSGDDVFV